MNAPSACSAVSSPNTDQNRIVQEALSRSEQRLGWWRDARFGMFIHWGVYSELGGIWRGNQYKGYSEHIQRMATISMEDYRREVVEKFNPTKFHAEDWVRQAKLAGMGYMIITAKHHDGFAMYDSKASDYNIVKATPFARDPMKELRDACKKYGLRFGLYYSHAFDWGDENGPGNDWEWNNPGGDKFLHGFYWWENYPEFLSKARKYVDEKSIPQILELIQNHRPDILWFDTPVKLPPEENLRILAAVRQAGPDIVVNGRLISGLGDYLSTQDQPFEFTPESGDWEAIPTTNDSYGYSEHDKNHKPAAHFIQMLAKAAARGGNLLLNIGPRGDGTFDPLDSEILREIAAWWKINGESIQATTRTPLAVQAWGQSTRKGRTLYLHVLEWPRDGKLIVGGLKTEVMSAKLLADPSRALPVSRNQMDVTITLPQKAPDPADSVIALECLEEPLADTTRLLANNVAANSLLAFDGKLLGNLKCGEGTKDSVWVHNWLTQDEALVWPVRLNEKTTFTATLFYDAPLEQTQNQLLEGQAGKKIDAKRTATGGIYAVSVGGQKFTETVRNGVAVSEPLGSVTLEPGNYEIRVQAQEITGEELFRLSRLDLAPRISKT